MGPKSKKRAASSEKNGGSNKKAKASGKQKSKSHQSKRFPLQKIHELLERKFPTGTVKSEAAIFLTAVLEYVAVEILELSANVAKSRKGGTKMTLQDILDAIQSDAELKELMDKTRGIA